MQLKHVASNGAGIEPSHRPQRPAHKDDTDDTDEAVSGFTYKCQPLRFFGRRRGHIPDTNDN